MRFFADAQYSFLSKRKIAYVISGVTILLLLGTALFFQASRGSWLNYGVDFLGGTLVQVRVDAPTDVAEVRQVVGGVIAGPEVTRFGEDTEFLVRAPQIETEAGAETADVIVQALQGQFGADAVTVERTEVVGPKIGAELQGRAAMALIVSFAATLIYLAFRFEWRFGVAAVIATLHDILVTLGLISLFQLEVSLPTVAAVLTIVGYSLNDTIIVFDRIRENLPKLGRREGYEAILDRSINEVLPRTIMTSGTTLGALIALFLLGGNIIQDFAMILILGILIGTYSSIFVASPALYEIERRTQQKHGGTARKEGSRAAAL